MMRTPRAEHLTLRFSRGAQAGAAATLCNVAFLLLTPATAMTRRTRARRKEVAHAAKPLLHEAIRGARNARTARITENAPVTPRT